MKRYSSGLYVRLAFAAAAHLDPEILLVDEVLAVGEAGLQKKCVGKAGDSGTVFRTLTAWRRSPLGRSQPRNAW